MGRRHFKPEQIIHMLREAEIKLAGGKTTVYEGGLRVPMVVRDPYQPEQNRTAR